MALHNIFELAAAVGVDCARPVQQRAVELIAKAVYKGTECGAWVQGVGNPYAIEGVRIGSIVEGTDAETRTHTLLWPITPEQFWATVQAVEDEAADIWADSQAQD
jgi:hypothetical protein